MCVAGTLGDSFAQLTQLEYIDLGGNELSGSLPSNWQAPNLKFLNLTGNLLNGSLPSGDHSILCALPNNPMH